MRWIVLCVGLVGCGRIGFEPIVDLTGDAITVPGDAITGDGQQPGTCNMAACASAGGACMGDICVINVSTSMPVMCPAGHECRINCNSAVACQNGIDCSMATHCTIDCRVGGTCNNEPVQCSTGGCDVYCRVQDTCNGGTYTCPAMSCPLQCCASLTCNGVSGTTFDPTPVCP